MRTVIASIVSLLIGIAGGSVFIINILGAKTVYYRQIANKHFNILFIFNHWLELLEEGRSIELYFEENDYHTIAIYGMGYLGKHLLKELEKTDIEVKYLLDRQLGTVYGEIPVLSTSDVLKPVDVIVVTTVGEFYSIRKQLRERTSSKIIFVDEIFRWHLADIKRKEKSEMN